MWMIDTIHTSMYQSKVGLHYMDRCTGEYMKISIVNIHNGIRQTYPIGINNVILIVWEAESPTIVH